MDLNELIDGALQKAYEKGLRDARREACKRVHLDDDVVQHALVEAIVDRLLAHVEFLVRHYQLETERHVYVEGTDSDALEDWRAAAVNRAMEKSKGNKTEAARLLRIDKKTLYNILTKRNNARQRDDRAG